MLLKAIQIKDYKCVTNSNLISIEPNVTCLVGKNESGKTALLECLYRLNPVPSGHRSTFEELYDYPRSRRSTDANKIPKTRPITATFELEKDDIIAVENDFGKGIITNNEINVSKDYGNSRHWSIQIDEKAFINKLGFVDFLSDGD
ncbi:MAG: AAA family ATPase [bacterium]